MKEPVIDISRRKLENEYPNGYDNETVMASCFMRIANTLESIDRKLDQGRELPYKVGKKMERISARVAQLEKKLNNSPTQ